MSMHRMDTKMLDHIRACSTTLEVRRTTVVHVGATVEHVFIYTKKGHIDTYDRNQGVNHHCFNGLESKAIRTQVIRW